MRIQNLDTGAFVHTLGLIDTGADECSLPAAFAGLLGHNLTAGTAKTINTGNGVTIAYGHTCTVEIFDTRKLLSGEEKVVYSMPRTIIDFMPNLHCVLLGVRTFLSRFELTVNYPQQLFSIRKPPASSRSG